MWNTSALNTCRPSVYGDKAPLAIALPLYGYVLPVVVVVTLVTNVFIVVVLSKKHLRTPSNLILLSMAVCEAFTGLVSLPYMLFFYSLKGYESERLEGLPRFWCEQGVFLIEHIPTMLHTAIIWQTVFLAIQRYVYVCVRGPAKNYCTMAVTRRILLGLICGAVCYDLPKVFANFQLTLEVGGYRYCCGYVASWVSRLGEDLYFSGTYWLSAFVVHLVPCVLMLVFSGLLMLHISKADRNRKHALRKTSKNTQRKVSSFMNSYQSSTRMLVVVIAVFLCTEIPAAVIYVLHVLLATTDWFPTSLYLGMNRALTVRNAVILVSYPFNFAVYCCMSNQFRLTVSQLFTKERLFVEQKMPAMGRGLNRQTRYSVILVSTRNLSPKLDCESCV